MKIKHTNDSPILLKIIPESPLEAFKNGAMAKSLKNMKIDHRVKGDGTLVLNIDPDWKAFTERDGDCFVKYEEEMD